MRHAGQLRDIACVTVLIGMSGCDPFGVKTAPTAGPRAGDPVAWFVDEASARGLEFTYTSGADGRYHMPEIMGGGAALFDMDDDGDLDAYLVQGGDLERPGLGPANRLFRNDGHGAFTDVTDASGADDRGYGMGVACGDHDNDGDIDLFVTNYGPDVLLSNDGTGRFTDVTEAAGIDCPGWSTSAAFVDVDLDGHLDLFVCGYLDWSPGDDPGCFNTMGGRDYCSPRNFMAPARDTLYRFDPDAGRYVDATEAAGLASATGTGLGVVCGDFNGDGRPDLYVANDGMADHLWLNGPDGRFVERGVEWGCAFDLDGRASAGMGVATADVDDDGDLDVLVGNLRNESDGLFLNVDGRLFSNATARAGLGAASRRYTRFGLGLVDFDHDGRLDLYQANGRVMRQAEPHADDPYAEPNLLFRGDGSARFRAIGPGHDGPAATSRGAAFGDVDGDGGVDILVVNRDGAAHLLMNAVSDQGHWIGLRVVDTHGRDDVGARVTIEAADRTVVREVRAASSYLASSDLRVHVGLGDRKSVDRVTVRFSDGGTETFGPLEADEWHVLVR